MNRTNGIPKTVIVFVVFTLTGFILYYPVLGNTFLSDDYDSLYRICVEKRIIYREFLRPMIDISFYFNYLLSGFSASSYYLFNLSIHILNAFFLYRLVLHYESPDKNTRQKFAFLCSFLFLIYPFHNESIAWLSGRLSSMACLFALLSLNVSIDRPGNKGFFLSAFLYILGLLCYESILMLPAIILIMTWHKYKSYKKAFRSVISWILVVSGYLLLRFYLSGGITGSYGERTIDIELKEKILNAGKVIGRLFLPPSERSKVMTLAFAGICFAVLLIHWILIRKKVFKGVYACKYIKLVIVLLISLLIPIAFGVSTRTSEGDRLLYFPSCFLCILIGTWIMGLLQHQAQIIVFALISVYFIFFLEKNNRQWIIASDASRNILRTIGDSGSANITLINLPDEMEGAFVFRNGFYKSLALNKVDTSKVTVMNYLKRLDYITAPVDIPVRTLGGELFIYPSVTIKDTLKNSVRLLNTDNNKTITLQKDRNLIYYWNKHKLIRIF